MDLRRGTRQLRVGTPDADHGLPAGPTLAFAAGLAAPRAPGHHVSDVDALDLTAFYATIDATPPTSRLGSSLRCVLADAGYCNEPDLLELVDGTKVRANASKRKAMSYERIKEAARLRARRDALGICVKASPRWRSTQRPGATTRRWRSMGSPASSRQVGRTTRVMVGMLDEINETFGVEPAVVLAMRATATSRICWSWQDRGIGSAARQVAVDGPAPCHDRMGEKLASPAGKARYAQRKWLSEAPNGGIKEVLGFRRFSLRGLAKVRGEWDLVCLALNIKRMGTVATC